ncbi:3197_t:CDS:2, partial [Diversispora eburnea]
MSTSVGSRDYPTISPKFFRGECPRLSMTELYWLIEIWYKKATNDMDRLYANNIHTWIALDKPSFQDLLQHEPRAFGWREVEFYDNSMDSKVVHTTFETSEDK